tara:strand:- start:805 stop:1443 length:639 start_codon:yes stop_codon:yes gene_type:complete
VLILASASKARHSLLNQAGVNHQIMVSDIDEGCFENSEITLLVQRLSFAKAEEVFARVRSLNSRNNIFEKPLAVLGCDSLFEFKGDIFGKPSTNEEAFERWKRMSSEKGEIHTGHTLLFSPCIRKDQMDSSFSKVIKGVVSTSVYFEDLSDEEIRTYVDNGESLKCAGGFAIDGKASMFIKKIDGCYSNVIGLSLPWLRNAFNKVSASGNYF